MIEYATAVNLEAMAKWEEKKGNKEIAGVLRLVAKGIREGLAEIERLRAALKPFALQIEAIECTTAHEYRDGDRWPVDDDQVVKIGDLRRARDALRDEQELSGEKP